MEHISHPAIIQRLKRARGHLDSIIAMLDAQRPCLEVAQQLHAVEKAVTNAKRALIHDHIDHCLHDTAAGRETALREMKQLAKYL